MRRTIPALLLLFTGCIWSSPLPGPARVSRALQLTADGRTLWVTNPESDSISQIDVASRTLTREILLAPAAPVVNPITQRYDPTVRPRAIAVAESMNKAYVAGDATSAIYVIDTTAGELMKTIPVGAAPVAVVVSPDDSRVYAVSDQAATVARIDTATDTVVATLPVGEHPRGASLRADGSLLYITQFLSNPGVTVMRTAEFVAQLQPGAATFTAVPPQPQDPSGNIDFPSGQPRGLYTVVPQPLTGELWVPHLLLDTNTPQPTLNFQSTVFPTFTLFSPGATTVDNRVMLAPHTLNGSFEGNFIDVVSGPRDVAFTPDGKLALVADAQSEDVLVLDAIENAELDIVRPIPSALLEGIVVDATGTHAYVLGRNTHNVTVLSINEGGELDAGAFSGNVAVDGDPIECLSSGIDPMPSQLRRGQRIFYTSNSSQFPVTNNFWVACSTCHLEGGSDAVTWKFAQGPRDTPSNAGGPINTGFLFRQGLRNTVLDYDITIRVEQGGSYNRDAGIAAQTDDLMAMTDFVNYAIPFPPNPNVSASGLTAAQLHGQQLFGSSDGGLGCIACHSGDFFTDSGKGNPTLDLTGDAGPVVLHDMTKYTCVLNGPYNDVDGGDVLGDPRAACLFDTPTLRGVFATAPYMHDGSSATLLDAVTRMATVASDYNGVPNTLSAQDLQDLAAYVSSL